MHRPLSRAVGPLLLALLGCSTPPPVPADTDPAGYAPHLADWLQGVWELSQPLEHTPDFLCSSSNDEGRAALNPPGYWPLEGVPVRTMRLVVFRPTLTHPEGPLASGWLLVRVRRGEETTDREYVLPYQVEVGSGAEVRLRIDTPTRDFRLLVTGDMEMVLSQTQAGFTPAQQLHLRRVLAWGFSSGVLAPPGLLRAGRAAVQPGR